MSDPIKSALTRLVPIRGERLIERAAVQDEPELITETQLAAALVEEIEKGEKRDQWRHDWLRDQLREIFMADWDLVASKANDSTVARQIFGLKGVGRRGYGRSYPHLRDVCRGHSTNVEFDHQEIMKRRGGLGYVVVNQPYNVDEEVRAEWREIAEQTGSVVLFPDFPSWWYPGSTTLILNVRPELHWHDYEQWTGQSAEVNE